jgi:steroid delta-isomerase
MLAEDVTLRDWKISVRGKAAALAETSRNFQAARTIEIESLYLYENTNGVAGELKIVVDGTTELYVVDVVAFDREGRIKAIRAYLGRDDE